MLHDAYLGYSKSYKEFPLELWVPRDKKGELLRKRFKLPGALLLTEGFEGFTEEGVIGDSYGHGLSTVSWNWLTKMLPRLTVNDKPRQTAKQAPALAVA